MNRRKGALTGVGRSSEEEEGSIQTQAERLGVGWLASARRHLLTQNTEGEMDGGAGKVCSCPAFEVFSAQATEVKMRHITVCLPLFLH